MIVLLIVLIAISVAMIYDGRMLAESIFSANDKNKGANTLKIIGTIVLIASIAVLLFVYL